MVNIFECVLCITFLITASQQADDIKLPSEAIPCQIDSPDRDECLKRFMQDMLSQSVNGMKSLGIPSIDPYVIDSHTVTYKRGENVSVTATMINVNIHGASKAKIMDVKTDITKDHIITISKTHIPESIAEGSYRGEGRYKYFKLKTKGYFNVTATNVNLVSTSEGDIITINGKEYVNFTKFEFTPQFGDVKVFITGLFPDQDLNRMTIEIVNKYWPIFLNESMPLAQETIEPILIERANKVSLRVPFHSVLA